MRGKGLRRDLRPMDLSTEAASTRVLALAMSAVLLVAPSMASPRVDPEKGTIRTIFVGDAFMEPYFPAPLLVQDPIIELTLVPAQVRLLETDNPEIRAMTIRSLRAYFPRRREDLWSGHDVMILAATQADLVKDLHKIWMRDGVVEDGMGFIMGDDPASFGGVDHGLRPNPSWGEGPVGEILSVECASDRKDWGFYYFNVKVLRSDNPMVRGLDWSSVLMRAHNRVLPRQGTDIVLETKSNPANSPVLAWWDVGKGRSISLVYDWGKPNCYFYHWPYIRTFFANMVYYAARAAIPADLELVNRIRDRSTYFSSLSAYILSLIEFVDRFGANPASIYSVLVEAQAMRKPVERQFVEGDFEAALATMEAAIDEMEEVYLVADRVMKRALFWVYVTEWLVVSGTAIFSTYLLWSLMIRRRLYREVEATRLKSVSEASTPNPEETDLP